MYILVDNNKSHVLPYANDGIGIITLDPFPKLQVVHIRPTNGGTCHASRREEVLTTRAGVCLLCAFMSGDLSLHFPRCSASKLLEDAVCRSD